MRDTRHYSFLRSEESTYFDLFVVHLPTVDREELIKEAEAICAALHLQPRAAHYLRSADRDYFGAAINFSCVTFVEREALAHIERLGFTPNPLPQRF